MHGTPDVHLLIKCERGQDGLVTETLMGNPAGWDNCQQRWQAADDARIAAGVTQHQLHYKVRAADDPACAGLIRLYVSPLHAAHAMVRRSGVSRWRMCDALGLRAAGWWNVARQLEQSGYIGRLRDGRAYLTSAARESADRIANPANAKTQAAFKSAGVKL